jgi:cell division protease FtsH
MKTVRFITISILFLKNSLSLLLPSELRSQTKFDISSVGTLIRDIEKNNIEQIYFSDDLKKVYFEEIKTYGLSPYRIANSVPDISKDIISLSSKKNIEFAIIEKPINPVEKTFQDFSNFGNIIFAPFMILFAIRLLFTFFSNFGGNNIDNPMLPPFLNKSNKLEKIKGESLNSNISLSSWAGSPEIFEECTEIVSYLNNSTLYKNAGAEVPKGILLEGPPGTGKTLIAKAIASETEASFFSISASEFIEVFVGVGASKVRELFKNARENKPSIIFIDEIDSIGKQRGAGLNMGGNDEREQTLNQLLAEMDGFESNEDIIVIAATNRKDILDKALLRPGRFDRIINVPLPDKLSRESILKTHMKNKSFDENVDVLYFADLTSGFSGAELKNLINEAAINAARSGNKIITKNNIEDALEKLTVGIIKKNDTRSYDIRYRIAIHEIGHAILTQYFSKYFKLKKVTMQSTYNGAGGYTLFDDTIDESIPTKELLRCRLIIALGGKAAETIFFGDDFVSLGATQDLKQANSIARKMINSYGMGKSLEVFYNEENNQFNENKYSDTTLYKIDKESLELVNDAYKIATQMIMNERKRFIILVEKLMAFNKLSGEEFESYYNNIL